MLYNGCEIMTLVAANTTTIFSLTYSDTGDWSEDADGAGYSLVNLSPESGTNLDLAENWSPSREIGGGSGAADLYTYAAWLNAHPQLAAASMAGEGDDFDNDGCNNLLEFALNSDPTDPASKPHMAVAITQIDSGTGAADYFTLSITRPIAIPGVTYTPETSATLNNDWDGSPTTVNAILHSRERTGTTETITYRSRQPVSSSNPHFTRLKIEKSAP